MKKKCGIYIIQNIHPDGKNKKYIGKSEDIERRWKDHKRLLNANKHGLNKSGQTDHLQRAWNNYGSESFEFHILKLCKSEELNHWEKIFTWDHQSFNPGCGYNRTPGGENSICTDEKRENLSKALKGRVNSLEMRRKMSKVMKGRKPHPNTIKAGIKTRTGKKQSIETIKKRRQKMKGRKLSKEHCKKISIRNLGNKYNSGNHHPEEVKRKISLSERKYMDFLEEWIKLREEGWSYLKIGRKYNISKTTIREYILKYSKEVVINAEGSKKEINR
jgi:group I intron endonuclease